MPRKRPALLAVSQLLLALFGLAAPAQGQFSDWVGTVGSDWDNNDNWSAGEPGGGTTARFNAGGSYGIGMDESNTVGGIEWVDSGASLTVASGFFSFSTLTVGSDFTVNGALNISGEHNARGALVAGTGMITNTASGTINFGGVDTSSGRLLRAGHLINNGAVNVNLNGAFDQTDGAFTNNNAVNIASDRTLTFGTGNVFNQNAGTLDNQGTFAMSDGTVNFNGGNFTGNAIDLTNSNLNINTSGGGVFNLTGNGNYSGDLADGQTLNLTSGFFAVSTLTATSDFTVNSTLNINGSHNARGAVLVRAGTITNAAGGTINFGGVDTSSGRALRADNFVNNGTVNVNLSATFDQAGGVYTNNGAISIASGRSLTFGDSNVFNQDAGSLDNQGTFGFDQDTLNYNGGKFTGNAIDLNSSTLNINTSGSGEFNMTGTGNYSGDLAAGQTLTLATTGNSTTTTATADFTNSGTIHIEGRNNARTAALTRAGTITNAAGGTINFGGVDTSSGRALRADNFVNQGTVNVNLAATFDQAGGLYANSGQIILHGRPLTVGNASTLSNLAAGTLSGAGTFDVGNMGLQTDGTIDPGFSAGTLTFDGDVTFGATADLRIELGGTLQGTEHDFLNGLDAISLDGSLSVRFLGGFEDTASPSDIFTIVSASTLNGTFAGLAHGDRFDTTDGYGSFEVQYVGSTVQLTNFDKYLDGDFDGIDGYSCADVDALLADIVIGNNSPLFDINGDSVVDQTDLDLWLAQAGADMGFAAALRLGDATLDGTVDGQDFLVWNANKFTNTTSWCSGNFNVDSLVDGQDFLAWNANKFTSSNAIVAIPEQTATGLLLPLVLLCRVRRLACRLDPSS